MKRDTPEYEAALKDMVEILLDLAKREERLIYYGVLSKRLEEKGGHIVPAHSVEMNLLLEDASKQDSPNGCRPMLSAMVILQEGRRPSTGFYKLARRDPFFRQGDNAAIWIEELKELAKIHGQS
jgi:hypothetical protein